MQFFSPCPSKMREEKKFKIGASFGSGAEDLRRVTKEEGGERQEVPRK